MARIRSLRHDFFMDEETACLPPDVQLLLLGLATLADRDGRLEDRPVRIKALLFPYRDVPVDEYLGTLEAAGQLQRYEADGKQCIALTHFSRDHKPHPKETSLGLPPPAAKSNGIPRKSPEPSGRVPMVVVVGSGSGCGSTASQFGEAPKAPAEQQRLVDVEPTPKPETPKKPPTAVAQWVQSRDEVRKGMIPPDAPQESALRKHQWPLLGEAFRKYGEQTLSAAWLRFAEDPYSRGQGIPMGLFVSQVDSWVSKAQAEAARIRLGGDNRPRLDPPSNPQPAVRSDKPRL